MKFFLIPILIVLFVPIFNVFAIDETIIELHNTTLDELLKKNIDETNDDNLNIIIESELVNNEESELLNNDINDNSNQENTELKKNDNQIVVYEEVSEIVNTWDKISKEDLFFLLENINNIKSPILRYEFLKILDISDSIPKYFDKEDFEKMIVDSILKLGDRKKAFQIIKNFKEFENTKYNSFYKEFKLNYFLSTYNLSESCDYRNEIKNFNLLSRENFFLKVDIFCLLLEEKFDEANLLNSLLNESSSNKDKYFEFLFHKLQNNESIKDIKNIAINDKNAFLYSAMHRIGNLALSERFLSLDPINLSMPIILSSATNIELRLKAAHLAYFNKLLNIDSLAALYQTVDFSFDELNNLSEILPTLNDKPEIVMAYFYQLINIQLLPLNRLESIIKFWDFAESNNLELIAYELSLKNLNSIQPSSELALYGARIAKAYTYNDNFPMAEKWLMFSESTNLIYELNSSKLLYNLFKANESINLINVLVDDLQYFNKDLIDKNNPDYFIKNETLNLIFSILNQDQLNPFDIDKKITETRSMPSSYITSFIRNAIEDNNDTELLLAIVASLNEKNWTELHPEHLRLILIGFQKYKDGSILKDILLEILIYTNII